MKKFMTGLFTLTLIATGCSSNTTGVLVTHPETQVPTARDTFIPPSVIQAPTIANDSPGQAWTFPSDPAAVMQKITKWLTTATVTTVQMPSGNHNLIFNAYIGPAELYFTDQNGNRVTVAPAFYIAHGNNGYYLKYFKDIVTYRDGSRVRYLKAPELFDWLANDKKWASEFRVESWTEADKSAIHHAKASKWGGAFSMLFPDVPGADKHDIPTGGHARPVNGHPVAGTCETLVDQKGLNRRVTFIEVWNNGKGQHRWTYVVSPKGSILSQVQSGDTPPQDWQ